MDVNLHLYGEIEVSGNILEGQRGVTPVFKIGSYNTYGGGGNIALFIESEDQINQMIKELVKLKRKYKKALEKELLVK